MNFWASVLGTILGIFLWNLSVGIIKAVMDIVKERQNNETKQIGFGDPDKPSKKPTTSMRKIGFGEN